MTKQNKYDNELLSAFIDAEQSDIETTEIVTRLLNDNEYKEHYIRLQQNNEYIHKRPIIDVRGNVSSALDNLAAHYSDDAVSLNTAKTEVVSNTYWFKQLFSNKAVSGLSIAASVMFVTFFTLQGFNSTNSTSVELESIAADTSQQSLQSLQQVFSPVDNALIQPVASVTNNESKKYQWIEADPVLSQRVREYVHKHESLRAAGTYDLQPKIRTAAYQINN